jgi:hypothetical protein
MVEGVSVYDVSRGAPVHERKTYVTKELPDYSFPHSAGKNDPSRFAKKLALRKLGEAHFLLPIDLMLSRCQHSIVPELCGRYLERSPWNECVRIPRRVETRLQ